MSNIKWQPVRDSSMPTIPTPLMIVNPGDKKQDPYMDLRMYGLLVVAFLCFFLSAISFMWAAGVL